ncbi:hypothetical protein [Tardiphaga sp.]|jgi:hypothetical protein|uniref:hypothetical protein n=1 Tax=Tardiphaga sp. TaxID=1926292 RepID=UPI0037DA6102
MTSPFPTNREDEMDRNTSAAIRNAIGERLRRDMGTDDSLPSHLQMLLSELQQRDKDSA